MPEPIATWNPARDVWETTQQGLLCEHLAVWSETWPTSGICVRGAVYELPTSEPRTAGSGSSWLLPAPTASLGSIGGSQPPEKRRAGGHSVQLRDVIEHL